MLHCGGLCLARRASLVCLRRCIPPSMADSWPLTLQDAEQSLELISAIYYSAATSTAVELPLPQDHPVRNGWAAWLPSR
jgi:hypothetical protein